VIRARPQATAAKPLTEPQRIARLPRVEQPDLGPEFDLKYLHPRWHGRPDAPALRPAQRLALYWIETARGLVGPIGCGHGKGLITMLAPRAANARRPVLFIPASMKNSGAFSREYAKFSKHWLVSRSLQVMSYESLSRADANAYLEALRPDMIIADEAHLLRYHDSARTKRVARYMESEPTTVFVGVSGTLTRKSVKDFAHLSEWALGKGSPLPMDWPTLEAFADALDSSTKTPDPASFGAMRPLGLDLSGVPFEDWRERAQRCFGERLLATAGVVSTGDASVGASLVFSAREPAVPEVVTDALATLAATWTRPDGEELATPLDLARVESTLRAGFYYRWIWPDDKPDVEWLEARAAWNRACRAILSRDLARFDSPFLVAAGLDAGALDDPLAAQALEAWRAVRERYSPTPPVEPVWLSDYLIDDVAAWVVDRLDAGERGIVWVQHSAVAAKLAECGLPVFGAGADPEASHEPVIACSIRAHGTGKNLQRWAHNLFTSWPPSGSTIEQAVARTHRAGQDEDEVTATGYAHDADRFAKSYVDAGYIERTTHTRQRLRYGSLCPVLRDAVDT